MRLYEKEGSCRDGTFERIDDAISKYRLSVNYNLLDN